MFGNLEEREGIVIHSFFVDFKIIIKKRGEEWVSLPLFCCRVKRRGDGKMLFELITKWDKRVWFDIIEILSTC